MRSGSPILFDVALYDNLGAGLTYANQAAFAAAGWTLAFIDMSTGIAVSPVISYTVTPVSGVTGRHMIAGITLTTAAWAVRITPPSASYVFNVLPSATWTGEQYDTDSLYSRINSVYGITAATAVPSVGLPALVEEDSYSTTIAVPTNYLSRMGWTDLAGTVLTGTIYRMSEDGSGTASAVLTEGADPRLTHNVILTSFDISWTVFPVGMVLTSPERTTGIANMRVEVQATKAGKTLTILYGAPLNVYRQDDET